MLATFPKATGKDIVLRDAVTISSLPVGTGLLVGEAVNYPLFIQIRQRKSRPSDKGLPLEQAAVEYQERITQSRKDAEDLM